MIIITIELAYGRESTVNFSLKREKNYFNKAEDAEC